MKSVVMPLLAAWCLFVVGCGSGETPRPVGSVTGLVTLGGNPVSAGTINFVQEGSGAAAMATLSPEGQFTVENLIAGDYAVSLTPPEPTPDNPKVADFKVPAKYRNPATSGLKATVKPGDKSDLKVDLTL